ncbi:MAG TPA: tRNA (adenosine(37)-N6)-threonylcarbamoyltransferase complex ATPase subunit type 1 TsaE, partial [bacterium (Candidatus Stahlbacteria)]|nr:tRNA (adenosine(37)-N6)-threonylcarbamoyltransferase complex ATPase subunit type 1 TsaE [Candidatus Stahlbacteria bacterium]
MRSTFSTRSPEATMAIGKDLASSLKSGDVVALFGELGSGKTTFIRGICQFFSIPQWVKSPS